MSAPLDGEGGSMKEVQSASLERDPDQDSLDSDSLGEEDTPCGGHATSCHMGDSPRTKCFINAAELMGDGDTEPTSARPDVLPRAADCPPAESPPLLPPPAAEVARLQSEEKRKGSLLFNGSGCSTPETLPSPQRHAPPCQPLPAQVADEVFAGRVWGDSARPDLVSAGDDRVDGPPPPPPQPPGESPTRRQPVSLDDVPIVAGHHEAVTPTTLPPRRPPDPQHVFFVDLNELPAAAEPAERPKPRKDSDSVYLYIDLNSGDAASPAPPRRPAGDAMSLSFHGATATQPRPVDADANAAADDDDNSETGEAMAQSLFYTVGETGRPRRPPPELTARGPRLEKRRRNLSLDCHARAERERERPPPAALAAAAAGRSPLLSGERTARPAGRSLGATPEAARRAARAPEPRRQEGRQRAGGRHATAPGRREEPESGVERDSLESIGSARRPATVSAPPRRRSAQRTDTGRRAAERAPPPETKPAQRTFLRSHSGRNAVSQPGRVTAPPPPPPRPSASGGSGGTLTRRKASARPPKPPPPPQPPQPQRQRPAPRPVSPRDSPPASDDASDVSSAKSFHRQSPETRNKQGIDELTADLLQMLSDGVHADVTIQVNGQEVSAHRCILATRSQYFRDLLEKPHHNVIHIDGHKLETVEFVLFHLYSGAMYVPEDVDLSDLITLAVMLGHKQLIRMAEFAMRVRLCHMFHKPCSECIPGVLETLCTAADCDLDDLAARCLAWVTQNRVAVWADPSFSEITDEYRAWCFQEAATLSQDTVLDVLLDCRRLSSQLPAARWSQHVRDMVETLLSNSVVFLSRNLGGILVSDKFMSLAESSSCSELEQYLLAAADVQNSADAHTSLEMISQLQSIPNHSWDKSFLGMLQRIKQVCNRRASGGQNYASLHMQRRSVRAQSEPLKENDSPGEAE